MDSSKVIGFYVRIDRPRGYMRSPSMDMDTQAVDWIKSKRVNNEPDLLHQTGDNFWMGKEWNELTGSFDSSQPYVVY